MTKADVIDRALKPERAAYWARATAALPTRVIMDSHPTNRLRLDNP